MLEIKLLLLIGIANGTPVIVKKIWGEKFDLPLDLHKKFADGRPILGPSKTIRGLVFSIIVTSLLALILKINIFHGILIGALAMVGDLFSSFIKRRLDKPSSSMALGLDQIPESLFPMVACKYIFNLNWGSVALVVLSFFIIEIVLSRILYRLKIRNVPY